MAFHLMENKYIIPHDHKIGKTDRNELNGHGSLVVWLTGLSGSGKSTLAGLLEQYLYHKGVRTYLLDGDNIRSGLNADLDFSAEARKENIRRIGELAKLFSDAGMVAVTAFISPFASDRQAVRNLLGDGELIEVHVDCPLEICEERDVKGLYKKARAGLIKNFTGIDSPFEAPEAPEVYINTHTMNQDECLARIAQAVEEKILN